MGFAIRLPGAWPSESCEGWQRIHELIAGTGFYVQMAGGVNFYNQAQVVHSKGFVIGGVWLEGDQPQVIWKPVIDEEINGYYSVLSDILSIKGSGENN